MVAGKDGNPLNVVELIADVFPNNNAASKPWVGDRIRVTSENLEPLSTAFFFELETKFGELTVGAI